MDRTELERRIRERRQEGPFHRGADEPGSIPGAVMDRTGAFVPEPSDELARHEQPVADEQPRVDYFDERAARDADQRQAWGSAPAGPMGAGGIPGAALPPSQVDWPPRDLSDDAPDGEAGVAAAAAVSGSEIVARQSGEPDAKAGSTSQPPISAPPAAESPAGTPGNEPSPFRPSAPHEPVGAAPSEPPSQSRDAYTPDPYYGPPDDGNDDGDDTGWDGYDDEPPRRGSGLAILGFLILGLAALLGGAFLFAAINAPKPAAQVSSPTPTSSTAAEGTATPTEVSTPSERSSTAPTPVASDGFSAKVQPCASSQMGFSGCVEDGTHLQGDQVWVWVGFKNGQASTVLGVTIVSKASNSAVADGSLELDRLVGCDPGKTCSGYMQMSFGNLDPGAYQIQVTRDGDPATSTSFTVGS